MSGRRRWGQPHVGDHVHFHTFSCDPANRWGQVVEVGYIHEIAQQGFRTRMCDSGEVEFTEHDHPRGHLTAWEEPPDHFYTWQAKQALIGGGGDD